MDSAPNEKARVRIQIHQLALDLAKFIEAVRQRDPAPGRIGSYRGGGGDHTDHPNLASFLRNLDVAGALLPLVPFRWLDIDTEPSMTTADLSDALTAVLDRWGWGKYIECGIPEPTAIISPEDPELVFTLSEERRLYRALRGLNWFLFTLETSDPSLFLEPETEPAGEDGGDILIGGRFEPVFFRTRRVLDMEEAGRTAPICEAMDHHPEAFESFMTQDFRRSFGIGREGQHPDPPRLMEIARRARAFLTAVETCLPIIGQEAKTGRPAGVCWVTAEYYACEAASALCDIIDGPDGQGGESSVAFAYGWDAEINYGLRSLADHVDNLLSWWNWATWERRLVHGKPLPEEPVAIQARDLDGLSRIVETIEKGIARLGDETTAEPRRPPGEARCREKSDKRWKIIKAYHDHPDWSSAQIAAEVGANRGHVSRVLKPLRARESAERRDGMPRGYKGHEGDIDAWTA